MRHEPARWGRRICLHPDDVCADAYVSFSRGVAADARAEHRCIYWQLMFIISKGGGEERVTGRGPLHILYKQARVALYGANISARLRPPDEQILLSS